jgi:hypothetical protein
MDEKQTTTETRSDCFCHGAGPQATHAFRRLWSEATHEHFRNSRVEFLKGIRSLIDERIGRLSRHEQKGTHVAVE